MKSKNETRNNITLYLKKNNLSIIALDRVLLDKKQKL